MADDTFYGDRGALTIGGTTVALLKGVEIISGSEISKLYGGGTIKRADAQRHSFYVKVKIKTGKFDPTVAAWWAFKIISPTSHTGASPDDTNACELFTVVATNTGSNGTICKATVTNVFFQELPMGMPEKDWWTPEFSGEGDWVTFANS